MPAFLTTKEVAALLRIKERKVYELVAAHAIPVSRVTGKLLFLGLFFITIGMPVNMLVVFTADWLASWLQRNKAAMRALDFSFAGVFSVFAVKIFMTTAR